VRTPVPPYLGWSNVNDEILELISIHLLQLRSLHLPSCRSITSLKHVSKMHNLLFLDLSLLPLTNESIDDLVAMTNLTELHLNSTPITDEHVGKISSSLQQLKILGISDCHSLSDVSFLDHLKKLPRIETLEIGHSQFSLSAVHSFFLEKRATLKKVKGFESVGIYCNRASRILSNPSSRFLDFSGSMSLCDKEFSFLIELIGDENSKMIEEINLTGCRTILSGSLDLIAEKMSQVKIVNLKETKFQRPDIENFCKKLTCEIISDHGKFRGKKE
jgi:hypothetical protein